MLNIFKLLLSIGILFSLVHAQGTESSFPSGCVELIMFTTNAESQTLYFTAENLEPVVWDYNFNINSNFSNSTVVTVGNMNSGTRSEEITGWEFSFLYDICASAPGRIGYSKYKISQGDSYFYIDYRDCRFWKGINGYYYAYSPDVWLLYDYSQSKFYFSKNVPNGWNEIINGSTINIWDIFDQSGNPNVDGFQPSNPTGLQIINSSGNPQLQWTASEPAAAAKYQIFRNNGLVHTTESGTTSWIDENISWWNSGNNLTYKIRGISGDGSKTSAGYSNEVTIKGLYEYGESESIQQAVSKTEIIQIYPNPFNPETEIYYSVHEQSKVLISVFDAVGRTIAILVDAEQSQGQYKVRFNGVHLSSGVYFCTLSAGQKKWIRRKL